jgi:hypothetical protein
LTALADGFLLLAPLAATLDGRLILGWVLFSNKDKKSLKSKIIEKN